MAQVRVQHSPMYGQPQTQGPVPNGTGQKLSRLEMMQADYQKKIMKEKEEKLIKLYEDNQKRAIERVNSRHGSGASGISTASYGSSRSGYSNMSGSMLRRNNDRQVVREADNGKSVREYFMEQRGQVGNWKAASPPNGTTNGVNHKPPFPTAPVQHRANPNRPHQANSANRDGRDKSRPLEPINYPQKQKQQIEYNPNRYADIDDAPNPPIQLRAQLARPGKKSKANDAGMNGHQLQNTHNTEHELEVDSSIPDRNQLQLLRQQHQQKQAAQKPEGEKKITDFQKWQMEQNAMKEKRLQDFRRKQRETPASYQTDSEDEEEAARRAETKRKEKDMKELLERIQQEQADLERMRRKRLEEEEWERQEKKREDAAQRKREALAKARKASMDDSDNLNSQRSTYKKTPSRFEYEKSGDELPPSPRVPQPPPTKSKPRQQKPAKPPKSNQAPKKWVPPASDFEDQPLPSKSTDNGVSFYAQAAIEAEKEALNLQPCPTCGRKFNADRLDTHRRVCVESKKPRKTFDMTKKRVEGSEAASYIKSAKKTDAYYAKKLKKTDWRKQHEGFIETVKYNKKMSEYQAGGGNILDLPPPPASENPDYEQCPYCSRKFNQAAAERHIPKCKDTKNRPAPPKGKRR